MLNSGIIEEAKRLASLGYFVFPCIPGGKIPATRNGWKDAVNQAELVDELFGQKLVNLAVSCQNGLLVVDLDYDENSESRWLPDDLSSELENAAGAVVETPRGGKHLYFRVPEGAKVSCSARKLHEKVDIRAEGGYVLAPPSILADGRSYCYRKILSVRPEELPTPPGWLLEKIEEAKLGRSRKGGDAPNCTNPTLKEILSKLSDVKDKGNGQYQARCPAHDDQNPSFSLKIDENGKILVHCFAGCSFENICKALGVEAGKLYPLPAKRGDVRDACNFILKRLRAVFYHKQWWVWSEDTYKRRKEDEFEADIRRLIQKWIDELNEDGIKTPPYGNHLVRNVIEELQARCLQPGNPKPTGSKLALANGILDIDALIKGEPNALLPSDPNFFSPCYIPHRYNPKAKCPKFLKMIEENLQGNKEKIRFLRQWFGYCLLGDSRFQCFLILSGNGKNGKSTVLAALRAMLGAENCSAVPIENMNGFYLTSLCDKLANIVDDMGEVTKTEEGLLKQITGGEEITINVKHKPAFQTRVFTKLIFATNVLPRFNDYSEGIWRRMHLLEFAGVIGKAVPGMSNPDYWKEEADGMLAWAVEGLVDLLKNDGFALPKEHKELTEEHRNLCSPLRSFVFERCELGEDKEEDKDELFAEYQAYCKESGNTPLARNSFFRQLKGIGGLSDVRRRTDNSARPRSIRGIALKRDVISSASLRAGLRNGFSRY